jgi:dolichol-phosphate mannosyltransferase
MPDRSIEYSAVIPMKNEEGNVAPLVEELAGILGGLATYEIIIVDDGSTDGTWAKLTELQTRFPALRPVKLDRNYGQSTGLWAGLVRARGRVILTMDGDMQNDPNDIPKILKELQRGADVCLTWRQNRQDTWSRRVQSRIGNGVRNWMLGSRIIDTGSQLRAFRTECIRDLTPFNGMHRFMGNLFEMRGYRIVQIPTHHRARRAGVAKYGMGNRAMRGLKDVLGVRWLKQRVVQYGVEKEG